MHPPATAPQNVLIGYAIMILVVGVVLFFRMRRMSRSRPLKIEQLWIVPAIYALVAVYMFVQFPPGGVIGWLLCVIGLAIGGGLGWQRGRMMRIDVDPETHVLNQKASPAAMFFILGLIVVRTGLRAAMAGGETWLHVNALTLTDALIAMALGLLSVQRLEMYLRAKRLLDEAKRAAA